MRAAFLALPLFVLLASSAQGADETVPSPAASDPNVVSSTPAATTPEPAEAETAAPATTDHANATAAAERPAAARTETSGQAVPAPTSAEETAKIGEMTKEEQAAMDVEMRRRGYETKTIDGEKRYCKASSTLGSRFNSKTLCWTADQIKSQQDAIQKVREKQGQRETWGQ